MNDVKYTNKEAYSKGGIHMRVLPLQIVLSIFLGLGKSYYKVYIHYLRFVKVNRYHTGFC